MDDSLRKGRDFPPETKTSFQRDVEQKDKKDECDLFSGTIIRLGQELGMTTPETSELAALIEQAKPDREWSTIYTQNE